MGLSRTVSSPQVQTDTVSEHLPHVVHVLHDRFERSGIVRELIDLLVVPTGAYAAVQKILRKFRILLFHRRPPSCNPCFRHLC